MKYSKEQFNKLFDHTILKPSTTKDQLKRVCDEAIRYGFCSVAVNSGMVSDCAEFLKGSDVLVDAAIGFPLGIISIAMKVSEAEEAIKNGAGEIDYVINIGKIKENDTAYIRKEMEAMVAVCRKYKVPCKVIFENCYLTEEEKIKLCEIAREVKPEFIKTSTGFGPVSATVEHVKLMRKHVGSDVKVKAAGGIRDLEICLSMLEAGADRIGCSNSPVIADAYKNKEEGGSAV